MTVPAWNPDRFHQTMSKTPEPPRPQRRFLSGKMLALGLALVFFGAAAVTATHGAGGEPDRIGICHATGSSEQPYVWLVVDEDGYEHAHHRHHAADFFTDAGAGPDACLGATAPVTQEETDATEPNGSDAEGAEDGDATEPETDGDATDAPEAPENTTVEPGDDSTGGAGNATADNETAEPEPLPGDAWVRQAASQDRFQVVLSLVVGNSGDGDATDVALTDALPDLRRSWALGGADADRCVLDGNDLTCWFGTLAPGETARVELLAYTDRMPCGDAMTNTAVVSSPGDAESRDNASSAGIQARAC